MQNTLCLFSTSLLVASQMRCFRRIAAKARNIANFHKRSLVTMGAVMAIPTVTGTRPSVCTFFGESHQCSGSGRRRVYHHVAKVTEAFRLTRRTTIQTFIVRVHHSSSSSYSSSKSRRLSRGRCKPSSAALTMPRAHHDTLHPQRRASRAPATTTFMMPSRYGQRTQFPNTLPANLTPCLESSVQACPPPLQLEA